MVADRPIRATSKAQHLGQRRGVGRRTIGVGLGIVVVAAGLGAYLVGTNQQPAHGTDAAHAARHPTPPATTTTAPRPPYMVQDETITLTDPNRNTPARGTVPGHSGRVLLTVIRRPVGLSGPRPLVVFAHGWNSNPMVYEPLLDTWAEAGYIVAAPTFPDSANTLPGDPVSNYPDQALDMSFVISSLLRGIAGPIDRGRIAVAGHSDGGADVALMALNPHYADSRVRAYLSLSGQIPSDVAGPWGMPSPAALFVAVGTADQYGLLGPATQVFQTAQMPKVLLTLAGGDHLTTFIGDTAAEVAMRNETARFLEEVFSSPTTTPAQLQAALIPTGDPGIALRTGAG
jgi:poly(3-hydroxybutyrate) depolymerase